MRTKLSFTRKAYTLSRMHNVDIIKLFNVERLDAFFDKAQLNAIKVRDIKYSPEKSIGGKIYPPALWFSYENHKAGG